MCPWKPAFPAGAVLAVLACTGVVSPPAGGPVASLVMWPDSVALAVGDSVPLVATALDAAGDAVAGASVSWSVADPSVASVTAAGVLLALAAGGTQVVAVSGDARDSAPVIVTSAPPQPPPPPAGLTECDAPPPGWIWCDDFESSRLSRYFEYDSAGGRFVRQSGAGRDGSWGMRARWNAGQVAAGSLKAAFGRTPSSYVRPVDAGTADYREVYWRVFVRRQPGWAGGGGDKLSRASIFATSNWSQAMAAHVWSGASPGPDQNYLVVDPASGTDAAGTLKTDGYNDVADFRWLGLDRGAIPLFGDAASGQWYCVEARVRLNDPGQANGVFQLWINGTLDAERTGLNWVGGFTDWGINVVFLENYWNAGSPQAQERYFDNFVIATQRIGC